MGNNDNIDKYKEKNNKIIEIDYEFKKRYFPELKDVNLNDIQITTQGKYSISHIKASEKLVYLIKKYFKNDKKVMTAKVAKNKKNKLYMMMAVVLLIVAVFMWYRNKKNKAKLQATGAAPVQTQVMQQRPMQASMPSMQQMPQMPPMQMGGMQQRLNPIQEIQLTQQMH